MGELVGFGFDLLKKFLRIWAKVTGILVNFFTKIFGQGIKICANNAKRSAKNSANKAAQAVKPVSKKAAIAIAAVTALAVIVSAVTEKNE